MVAVILAIICLSVFAIKSVAGAIKNIQPREYQKVDNAWPKYEAQIEDNTRPATKKEFADAGLVSSYIEGTKVFCRIKNEEVVWCDYWNSPPNDSQVSL